MTATTDEFQQLLDTHYDTVRDAVDLAAREIRRRHREFTYDEYAQEGWAWVLSHKGRMRSVLGSITDDQSRKAAMFRLRNSIARIMRGLAETERAAGTGYQTKDLVWYGREVVAELLPAIWDPGYADTPPSRRRETDDAGEDVGTMPGAKRNPSEGGDWQAACWDVQAAWRRLLATELVPAHVAAAVRLHATGHSFREVGLELSVAASTAQGYYLKGLDALVAELNGGEHVPQWWRRASRTPPAPNRVEWEEAV